MGLRIRFQYSTGASLGYSVERLADGTFLDLVDSTFKASPATTVAPLPEDSAPFSGRYKVTLSPTSTAQYSDGNYAIAIHDLANQNLVIGMLGVVMHSGDDAAVFPSVPPDPWSIGLPGSYVPGTAGAILAQNLDARVSTRSTYAGGPVSGVVSPVTVGTVNDKSGYILAVSGLDAITIENGVNARQAFSPILAAAAGVISGAGTGSIVIRGANVATPRITATTDNVGNRSSVVLSLPA